LYASRDHSHIHPAPAEARPSGRAGIGDLTFHDFRGTAVVRLAIAGATVPQIATFTGHSQKDVEAILDAHYLG
jgi:integrase